MGNDGHDTPTVDISKMLATYQTALAVIDKYGLPRDRHIKLRELPSENFDTFVLDMWHTLQSREKPLIDPNATMLELQRHDN